MKKKHILAILLALGCSAAAAGAMACQTTGDDGGKDQNQGQTDDDQNPDDQNPDDQNPDEPDENSIAGIAKNGKKGTQYTVEGVVYGELSDGYFISDGTGGIFVADDEEVSVGDKLSVTATLSVTRNVPSLTSATAVTVTAQGQTALAPEASSLSYLNSLTAGRANYYKYLTVAGTLSVEDGQYILTEGSDVMAFDERSNTQHLEAWVGRKIDVSVITTGFGTYWEGAFIGDADDVKEHEVNLEAVKDDIFKSFSVPGSVYVSLELPTEYTLEPNVEFTWSVVSGQEVVSITDNVAEVTPGSADTNAVLRLTLSAGEQTASKDYTVIVHPVTAVNIADIDDHVNETVMVSGTVLAKGHAQTQYRCGLLITDGNGNNLAVDIDRTDLADYSVGDTVKAVGSYTPAQGGIFAAHFSAIDHVCSEKAPEGYSTDYSALEAVELSSLEDYQAVITDPAGNANKLYKIVMPYMILSGNTSYNFVRFGATEDTAGSGLASSPEGYTGSSNWHFCFAINSLDLTVPEFYDFVNPPFLQDGAAHYEYLTIYAYAMYDGGSTGSSTWQFVIPEESAIVVDYQAYISSKVTEAIGETAVVATEAGTMNIPKEISFTDIDGTVQNIDLAWQSSDAAALNPETGAYAAVAANKTVTLTASYKFGGESLQSVIEIDLLARDLEVLTVTQWLTAEEGEVPERFYLEAVVASIGSTSGNSDEQRNGVILTDGINTLWYKTDEYTYGSDQTHLAKGDKLRITGAQLTKTGGVQELSGGTYAVVSSGNDIDYSGINLYGSVSSDEELAALAAGMSEPIGGVAVKFSGVFSFVGTGSSNCRYQLNYKDASSSADARYRFGDSTDDVGTWRTFSFSVAGNNYAFPGWYETCGMPEGKSSTCYPVEGTIIAVSCSSGKTMYAWSIIAIDCEPYVPSGDISNILTVSEALGDESGEAVYVQGIVGAFGAQTASGQGDGFQKGLILTDGTNVLLTEDLGDAYRAEEDGAYTIDGQTLAVGDEVLILGKVSGTGMTVSSIEIVSTGKPVVWSEQAAVTVSNDAELEALAQNAQEGVIIKFVGTEENPFFLGGSGESSGGDGCNYKLHYKNDASIVANDGVKYNGKNFVLKGGSNEYLLGESWWTELGLPAGGFVGPNSENPANKYGYTGTFYAVITGVTGSYYQMIVVNAEDFSLVPLQA